MKQPLSLLALVLAAACASAAEVKLVEQADKKQVDILVDGQPFTSYVFWADQKKPLLSPLRTANGNIFTRGFPLEKVAGERTDHPHHISSWFNYGNVNGTDFWNSPPEGFTRDSKIPYGNIKHKAILAMKSGEGSASLKVSSDWILADGSKVLQQDETLVFRAAKDLRIIDRIVTLTAQDKDAVFKDSKEGVIAIRVTRSLEEPSEKAEIFRCGRQAHRRRQARQHRRQRRLPQQRRQGRREGRLEHARQVDDPLRQREGRRRVHRHLRPPEEHHLPDLLA